MKPNFTAARARAAAAPRELRGATLFVLTGEGFLQAAEVDALLLEHGADVNARADNKFRNSPLQRRRLMKAER